MMWKVLLVATLALAAFQETHADINIALGRLTAQTSTLPDWTLGVAGHGVDGNPDGNYFDGHCTHTLEQANPMWWVDLGQPYTIVNIVIFNRLDCCSDRLNPFRIFIGDDGTVDNNPMCGGDHVIDLTHQSISIICQMPGRYVAVMAPGASRILSLCEVQVFIPDPAEISGTTTLGPPLPPQPPCIIWIWIVIDVSSSISVDEFLSILHWLLEFIQCFDGIDVQIGIITYECLPYMDVRIGTYPLDDPALVDAINGLERRGGRTRTGLALHYVKCMSDIPEDACGVVILVSDGSGANGQGTDNYIANAAMLRDSGFALYAVAAGNFVNTAALATITGDPDRVVDQTDPCGLATRVLVYCCPVV